VKNVVKDFQIKKANLEYQIAKKRAGHLQGFDVITHGDYNEKRLDKEDQVNRRSSFLADGVLPTSNPIRPASRYSNGKRDSDKND
jgi:hypothetical protein